MNDQQINYIYKTNDDSGTAPKQVEFGLSNYQLADLENRLNESRLKLAQSDLNFAQAFQTKTNSLLLGMQEIRLALQTIRVDDEKEKDGDKEKRPPLKGIFEDGPEKNQLKKRYGEILDLYANMMKENLTIKPKDNGTSV